MGQKIVKVLRKQGALSMEPERIELADGDWVQWEFPDLAEGQFGFISFAPPLARLGPFHSLRSYSNNLFLGKGNKGILGDFAYTALILHPDEKNAIASGTGTITNRSGKKNMSPDIEVSYDNGVITVRPEPLCLNAGDTATWRFVNLPDDAFACFQFDPVTDSQGNPVPGTAGASGPFLAFNACRVDGAGVVEASGMGFTAAIPVDQRPGQFTYHLQLRRWDGTFLAGHDPIIDNLGPPVPTGGG